MALRKTRRPGRPSRVGHPAAPIRGAAPDGRMVSVEPEGRDLYFLTSSCRPCLPVWAALDPERAVVVTPDASTENRTKVAELAPDGVTVVMASDVWFAYSPGPAPWRMSVVDGVVASEGPART